jgi:hypothetical protein
MSQIDFLPEKYRQRDVHRKNRWSRVVVVFLFAGLLAAGGFVLRKKRLAVAAELDLARQSHETMMAETMNLAKAMAQLSEARGEANLVAYLRHPWSRARIVAAIVQDWPESLVLQELKIQPEAGQGGRANPIVAAPPPENQAPKPPAQADLAELRRDLQLRPTVVLLSGLMTDHAALRQYLAALGKLDLFSNVELLGMAPADDGRALKFNVRLSLAPGYGQSGGPSAPPQPRKTAEGGRQSATASGSTRAIELPLFAPPPTVPLSPSAVVPNPVSSREAGKDAADRVDRTGDPREEDDDDDGPRARGAGNEAPEKPAAAEQREEDAP